MSIKVLLADDHPVVRQGLRRMLELESDMEVVGEAATGEEVLDQLETTRPGTVLVDVKMPGMGGIEAIRRIKERNQEINVIVLTLYGDQYLTQAIEAGAVGYLVKDAAGDELIRAIRAVHKGQSSLHPSLSRELFNEFASLARNNHKGSLTQRELEMIRLIASGATNREIAGQFYLSETTVKREVSRIFDKLRVKDRAEAVSEAYKRGLL
ncbi:MAG: response regulator transcription factor [Chloroflexota bacterium]|nr:response regulator transcription factor [Chloroflexota bacterium]